MDFRDLPTPQPPSSLLTFTTTQIYQYYPNLPFWAVQAFHILKRPQEYWTREAFALLNMSPIPPFGNRPSGFRDCLRLDSDQLLSGDAEEKRRRRGDIDLWRLNLHLHTAREGPVVGWGQSEGMETRNMG
jgi:hypothetical protein